MVTKQLAHMVYFTLNDSSEASIESLLTDMRQFLDQHPGLVHFSCGRLNQDLNRPVNDREFHVSLHTVFADRAAHDAYQAHPRHTEFIQRNRDNWKKVRVFDADC